MALFGNKTDMPKDKWKVTTEEAKEFAQKNGIKIYQPLKVRNNPEFIEEIKSLSPGLKCTLFKLIYSNLEHPEKSTFTFPFKLIV